MALSKFREGIDTIDSKIVELLNARCELAAKVGEWKKKREHPIYVPERECALFQRLKDKNNGPISNDALSNVYREIISGAIAVEQPLTIARLETVDDFNHPARLTFGDSAKYITFDSPEEALKAISNDLTDYAVVDVVSNSGKLNSSLIPIVAESEIFIVAERHAESSSRISWVLGKQHSDPSGIDRTALMVKVSNSLKESKDLVKVVNDLELISALDVLGPVSSPHEITPLGSDKDSKPFIVLNDSILLIVTGHSKDKSFQVFLNQLNAIPDSIQVLSSYPVILS